MSDITPFTFPTTGQSVRTLLVDGEPWFVAADVCTALGYSRIADALRIPDADDLATHFVRGDDGLERPGQILNEAALYSLILRSNRPEAKAFKRWVTHDVLPSIRKTGSYSVRELTRLELIDLARDAELGRIEAETRALAAEHVARELAPAARAWDVLASADGDYSAREAANILNRDPAIDTGQNRLLDLLRDWQLIDRRDIPYATHSAHVRLRPRTFTNRATQEEHAAKPQVRVTAQGIRYLHKRLGGTGDVREYIAQGAD